MPRAFHIAAAAILAGLVSACASGPTLSEVASRIAPIAANQGRVWFYRSSSPLGAAVQPSIFLNGRKVGESIPGGFFYTDMEAGPCIVTTTTETDYSVKFQLEPQDERYIKTTVVPGILVGRVIPSLVDPAEARSSLASKSYTGGKPAS